MIAARLPTLGWLALGVVGTVLAANRFGLPALTWLAPVPLLVATARTSGWRGWLALTVGVFVAQVFATLKIVTAPLPPTMALGFGVPMAAGAMALLGLWRLARDRAGAIAGIYAWPALVVVSDWLGFAHSELSAWTTSANGLVGDLPLMQLTALGGMGLVGGLVAWVGAIAATALLSDAPRQWLRHATAAAFVLLAAGLYGAVRLDQGTEAGPTVRVAAVVTELGLGATGLPDAATLHANTDDLFHRSEIAVAGGAKVVAWNEAAAFVQPDEEAALLDRGRAFARDHAVDLILAYGVQVSSAPISFRNEFAWFGADGAEVQHYAKHHPVPGEPSVRGDGPLLAVDRPYGVAAGAICYDWDFPATARAYAQQGAGLVFVPSSDWRGIDPTHTQMAGVRAIESGLAVLRPVRASASAGFDAYGRVRGWMSAGQAPGVLIVDLPTTPVPTLYTRFGDAPVLIGAALVLLIVALTRRPASPPAGAARAS